MHRRGLKKKKTDPQAILSLFLHTVGSGPGMSPLVSERPAALNQRAKQRAQGNLHVTFAVQVPDQPRRPRRGPRMGVLSLSPVGWRANKIPSMGGGRTTVAVTTRELNVDGRAVQSVNADFFLQASAPRTKTCPSLVHYPGRMTPPRSYRLIGLNFFLDPQGFQTGIGFNTQAWPGAC